MPTLRRRARTIALQALFEIDCTNHDQVATSDRLIADGDLPDDAAEFARELVTGVLEHKKEIDDIIQTYAPSFPVSQLAAVDRNILRLAIFELLMNNKVPVKVAINEAVELAKTFGSESSARFVNGVLGTVSTKLVKKPVSEAPGENPSVTGIAAS